MYPIGYILLMYSIYTTEVFDFTLKDQAKRRIQVRIDRVEDGEILTLEPVGEGVSAELRFFFGPGYRMPCLLLQGKDIMLCRRSFKISLRKVT
uniref:Uncharacterized protein n=1 Tax=Acinetobacter baumannii TaxID=470 RepID=A0A125S0V1_ACIBA|nr:hypothetical protein [Acinetobacter baumannii]